ncbi:hypothetical protein [Kitasatospora purpeofusca]|uniref:hypothetical protein n=1 Tax=Kitasatospora purpeofusca TaxID=67352 RepID=UPI000A9342F2|nr:hypothetical protein [Kitasatospora purpeofusca]MCX4756891.1 hypothetical protein [Kitasatospora purpeofusca]WSR35333.1 hypothetical protein OG715_32860 [Kitasatospora purpeofusca]WSR43653.1 hypothetical protein OG196_33900 [Kitasatospora purpeofusca]
MTVALEAPTETEFRDPRALLNAVRPYVKELTYNVFEGPGNTGDLYDREIALLLRDNTMVRNMAERILDNAIAYTITAMEHPEVHLGVGKVVDIGVHQLLLDTPVYFAICEAYNAGRYKHHAPLIHRRGDGIVIRTADFLRANGFDADEELWAVDGANCSPCDSKVPDSH